MSGSQELRSFGLLTRENIPKVASSRRLGNQHMHASATVAGLRPAGAASSFWTPPSGWHCDFGSGSDRQVLLLAAWKRACEAAIVGCARDLATACRSVSDAVRSTLLCTCLDSQRIAATAGAGCNGKDGVALDTQLGLMPVISMLMGRAVACAAA